MKAISYITLLLLLTVTACKAPQQLVYQDIQNLSLKQGKVSLSIRLYNPNHYNMKLKDADVDVFVNGNPLGKLQVDGTLTAPKNDTFLLPVLLNVDLLHALPNAFQILLSGDVTVKLAGSVKAGRHGIYITAPINYEGKQNLRGSVKW
jgi:LEA14-like dessication related protein